MGWMEAFKTFPVGIFNVLKIVDKLNLWISSIPSSITDPFYKTFKFYYFYGTQNRKTQSTALKS